MGKRRDGKERDGEKRDGKGKGRRIKGGGGKVKHGRSIKKITLRIEKEKKWGREKISGGNKENVKK